MIAPPKWTTLDLQADVERATAIFCRERLQEPLEAYLDAFDVYQGVFEELLETTVDLSQLELSGLQVLGDDKLREAFRYLAGPPMSLDDLTTLAETASLTKKRLQEDPALVKRTVQLVLTALDRRRFPWVTENREPTEPEKTAAVVASAALIASQRLGTLRRHEGKSSQEQSVEDALVAATFQKVATRTVGNLEQAPRAGEFCRESLLGTRKADFLIRLWDRRILALECKVSNSAVNSVKRVNNDAAAKAETWRREFGERQVVPAAMISGVFKVHNLMNAQDRGLTLFWGHDLDTFLQWIAKTQASR